MQPVQDEVAVPIEALDPDEIRQPAPGMRALEHSNQVDRLRHELALRWDVRPLR